MKRPYLDYWQRFDAQQDTLYGAGLRLHLAWMKVRREMDRIIRPLLDKYLDQ